MKKIKKFIFPIIMILSMILGSIIGINFPTFSTSIKPLSTLFLNLMFTLVVPLVFFTITSSISNMSSIKRLNKILKTTILVFVITSFLAALYMLIMSILINPVGEVVNIELVNHDKVNILEQIVSALSVSDFNLLLTKNNMLALILFSCLFGFTLNVVDKEKKVSKILDIISNTLLKMVNIIMYYAPIGVFAYFAQVVNEYGKEFLGSYAKTMLFYYLLAFVYFIVFYSLYSYYAYKKTGVKKFYKNIFMSAITSFATQSSLASLPTNLQTAKKMNIDQDVSSVSLPLGSTIHMEGSSMASILKIIFLFTVFNINFINPTSIIIALIIAVLSSVVMSGIPGGGLIGEMLIVSLYGFPNEAFYIISTIGWLVDPPATMLNVCGDISSAMIIDKHINKKV